MQGNLLYQVTQEISLSGMNFTAAPIKQFRSH